MHHIDRTAKYCSPTFLPEPWTFTRNIPQIGNICGAVVPHNLNRPTEDRVVLNFDQNVFAVSDGMSAPYGSGVPPVFEFNGVSNLSMGQVCSASIAKSVLECGPDEDLLDIAKSANSLFQEFHLKHGHNINNPGELGGTKCSLLKITDNHLQVMAWGDAIIAVEKKDGEVITSENQLLLHDEEGIKETIELLAKFPNDPKSFWSEYIPKWVKRLQENSNKSSLNGYGQDNGFTELNGSPDFPFGCSTKGVFSKNYKLEEIKRVILFTDGLAPFDDLRDTSSLAKKLFKLLDDGKSLTELIDLQRKKSNWPSYQSNLPEVSAVLLDVSC